MTSNDTLALGLCAWETYDQQRLSLSQCTTSVLLYSPFQEYLVPNRAWLEVQININSWFLSVASYSCPVAGIIDQQIHTGLGLLALWIIVKHWEVPITLYLVNQWQAMTHLHLAFGHGEPLIYSVWVSAHAWPFLLRIPILKRSYVRYYLEGGMYGYQSLFFRDPQRSCWTCRLPRKYILLLISSFDAWGCPKNQEYWCDRALFLWRLRMSLDLHMGS